MRIGISIKRWKMLLVRMTRLIENTIASRKSFWFDSSKRDRKNTLVLIKKGAILVFQAKKS